MLEDPPHSHQRRRTLAKFMPFYKHLSTEETKELLALQNKAEEKKDDDEDF